MINIHICTKTSVKHHLWLVAWQVKNLSKTELMFMTTVLMDLFKITSHWLLCDCKRSDCGSWKVSRWRLLLMKQLIITAVYHGKSASYFVREPSLLLEITTLKKMLAIWFRTQMLFDRVLLQPFFDLTRNYKTFTDERQAVQIQYQWWMGPD